MPNIEIHGYGKAVREAHDYMYIIMLHEAAFRMKERIDKVMQNNGYGDDAITTVHPTVATSCDGKETPMPYLRISNTKPEESVVIVEALKQAGIVTDVERLTLADFIPRYKMRG